MGVSARSIQYVVLASLFLVPTFHAGESRAKPVRIVVPFAPGGESDTLARQFAREINHRALSPSPWVVINVPGAGGTIGSRRVLTARPDGRTLLFLHGGILTAKASGQSAYGPEAFEAVAATGSTGLTVCVHEDTPFLSLDNLLHEASVRPDSVTFSASFGAPSFFTAQLLQAEHGTARFRFVNSGGGARRFAELSGGHVDASIFSISEYLSFRDGGLRALAFLGEERHPELPDLPTARESGIDVVYPNLQGWWAPPGTPAEVVESHGETLRLAFESETLSKAFRNQKVDSVFLGSSELVAETKKQMASLARVSLPSAPYTPPSLAGSFLLLFLAGVALIFAGRPEANGKSDRCASDDPKSTGYLPFVVLFLCYLAALQIIEGGFVLISILFLFLMHLAHRRALPGFRTLATAVAVPFALQLALGKLLNIQLP